MQLLEPFDRGSSATFSADICSSGPGTFRGFELFKCKPNHGILALPGNVEKYTNSIPTLAAVEHLKLGDVVTVSLMRLDQPPNVANCHVMSIGYVV